ncbi:MAG: protein TolR [Rhodospirillaceae bacterium]|nr:protein TolR [Rhodospirillaceae bacterium]
MAAFIKPSTGAKTSRRSYTAISEINVTPMVDVMLVLLVIFIVTAPLLTTGVNVNLPQTARAKSLPQDNKALTLFVKADGSMFLQSEDTKVDLASLRAKLSSAREANPQLRVYVKGDREVPYGMMMQAMAEVTAAGITQVAFVTDPPRPNPRSPR